MITWVRVAILCVISAELVACATTTYRTFEAKDNTFEGSGGTKQVVDGMEVWETGTPPRRFAVLGVIEDERPAGVIQMAAFHADMVKKAREVNGDAVVMLDKDSRIASYYTDWQTSGSGGTATTVPLRRNSARFAVIKYVD